MLLNRSIISFLFEDHKGGKAKTKIYDLLKFVSSNIWNTKNVKAVHKIIGVLGYAGKYMGKWLKEFRIEYAVDLLQKEKLLVPGKIIRQVLNYRKIIGNIYPHKSYKK